ncbi:hypothetical protein LXA43DRAFT_1099678 [Ganoderma leucocontextum]|nr:hypothetical protein LXA43DRAFT_1099678 [Ganoderma leucocontextum]
MNTVPPASSDPLVAPNTGPFVTMHISHYLSLIRQLDGLVQPSGPVTEHLSVLATSVVEAEAIPTIDVPSRELQAPETAGTTEGGSQPHKPHGKRSKVACYPCSDAHKTCDQGRPCRRCTKRGIDASCVYPPTKGGPRARKVIVVAGMPSAALPCFTNPSTLSTVPPMFDMFQNSMVGSYTSNSI